MKNKKLKIPEVFYRLGQKIKSKVNQEVLTYFVFLLIAITIWYLNALSEDYTAELGFAVKYTDFPEDKILANTPPERLLLTIHGQGFTLLKYRFGLILSPLTLEASYNTLRHKSQGDYYLATQSVFNRISAQLSSDVDLRQVAPDTLNFVFTETVRREIPVMPQVQLQFEKGFLPRGDVLVQPEKVMVTGPQTIIDTMQYVYTQTRSFRNLKDTLITSLNLQPVTHLRFSENEVRIMQAIQRHTEATVTVSIEPINLPEDVTMRVFPGNITVNCMVPIVDYERLRAHLFRAVVDYNSIRNATDNQAKASVMMVRKPDFVTDMSFHPVNVDFIIEK